MENVIFDVICVMFDHKQKQQQNNVEPKSNSQDWIQAAKNSRMRCSIVIILYMRSRRGLLKIVG